VVELSAPLGEEFLELVVGGRLQQVVEPFPNGKP